MSPLKIFFGALASVVAICAVMYYFTLYQNPPDRAPVVLVATPVPVTFTVPTPTVTWVPTPIDHPVKKHKHHQPNPKPTRVPKPRKNNWKAQEKWPMGKPTPNK